MDIFVLCCETLDLPEAFGLSFYLLIDFLTLFWQGRAVVLPCYFQVEVEVVLAFVLYIMSSDLVGLSRRTREKYIFLTFLEANLFVNHPLSVRNVVQSTYTARSES